MRREGPSASVANAEPSKVAVLRGCELIGAGLPFRHSGARRNPVRTGGIRANNQIDEPDPGLARREAESQVWRDRRGDEYGNRATMIFSQALNKPTCQVP